MRGWPRSSARSELLRLRLVVDVRLPAAFADICDIAVRACDPHPAVDSRHQEAAALLAYSVFQLPRNLYLVMRAYLPRDAYVSPGEPPGSLGILQRLLLGKPEEDADSALGDPLHKGLVFHGIRIYVNLFIGLEAHINR